jgi:NADH-quinone oxidoreductase subunit M
MILTLILLILFVSLIILFFVPSNNHYIIRKISLISSSSVFLLSLFFFNNFNNNYSSFQGLITFGLGFDYLNITLPVGLDGISILFFILSSFLILLCVVFVWNEKFLKEYMIVLLSINFLLLLIFSTLDLLFFYIFFEAVLIPMYLMIGFWGSRQRKIRAVYLFFFYTLVGSLCMLTALMYIYFAVGSLNYEYVYFYSFSLQEQYWLWVAFFLSFASKIPLFPFHIWLPEAHVEAPTVGSVLLAGILLKLGVYGFLRFNIALFPQASFFFTPLIFTLAIFGVIFASMNALRQTDMKRIIAYSSVAHMNLVTMGIFSFDIIALEGSILQSISHGFVSGGLFFLIGVLYRRYHSRLLYYFSGLTHMMPLYSTFFLILTMSNIALPGSSSFVGEFLILVGLFKLNIIATTIATLGVILCGSYSLWLYNRICFGNLKLSNILFYKDLDLNEFSILSIITILVIFTGIYPNFLLKVLHSSCLNFYFLFL